jgi:hypothetical protein
MVFFALAFVMLAVIPVVFFIPDTARDRRRDERTRRDSAPQPALASGHGD